MFVVHNDYFHLMNLHFCSVLCESSDTKRTPPILTILSIGIWADHLFFKWDSWCSRSVFVEMDLLKAFIKSIYEKAWRAIMSGCNHPMKKNESGELVSKLEKEWSANKDKLANNNWKAFNVIISIGLQLEYFKLFVIILMTYNHSLAYQGEYYILILCN